MFFLLKGPAGGENIIYENGWMEGGKDLMLSMREYFPLLVSLSAEIEVLASERFLMFIGRYVVLVIATKLTIHLTIKYDETQVSWGKLIVHYMEQMLSRTKCREKDVRDITRWVSIRKDRRILIKLYITMLWLGDTDVAWRTYSQFCHLGCEGGYYSIVTGMGPKKKEGGTKNLTDLLTRATGKVNVVKGNGFVLRPTLKNEVDVKDRNGKTIGKLGISGGQFTCSTLQSYRGSSSARVWSQEKSGNTRR